MTREQGKSEVKDLLARGELDRGASEGHARAPGRGEGNVDPTDPFRINQNIEPS